MAESEYGLFMPQEQQALTPGSLRLLFLRHEEAREQPLQALFLLFRSFATFTTIHIRATSIIAATIVYCRALFI